MIPVAGIDSFLADWLPPASLVAVAIAYATRMIHLADQGRPVPRWRQGFFLAGLIVLAVAYTSPIDALSDELLTVHMIQHLLVMDVAALCLVLGLTGPLMQPLLKTRGFRWVRFLGNPLVALGLWTVLLYVWHIPALYEAATFDSDLVHAVQHLSFFFAGTAFWMSLIGPLPKPAWFGGGVSAGFVVVVRLIGAVLANVLMWSSTVIYARYEDPASARGVEPLTDQGLAGVVMMGEGTLVAIAVLSWLVLRWAKQDTERQELLDLAAERGYELDAERAERAVNAGQGERLRERIEAGSLGSGASGRA